MMTALPNRHHRGHHKVTEIEVDQRTYGKDLEKETSTADTGDGGDSTGEIWMEYSL